MKRNITHALIMLILVAVAGIPATSAFDGYLSTFNQQYNTSGTRLDTCGVCHVNTGGGGATNSYGTDFANNGNSLTAIEALDSDKDGYSNIAEINARTFPGNPDDKPVSNAAPAQTPALATTSVKPDYESEELADDVKEYEGSVGPESALYGLKLAFENIDESFTFNESEKIAKKVDHARLRIAEAKGAWKKNNDEAAEKALEHYREKMEEANKSVSEFKGADSGLANAQQMIAKHEMILKNLLDSHPGNKGLERAYSNSQELKTKFEEKIKRKEAGKDREEETEEAVKIKAKKIGNDTQVEVELKFKSESTDNFTIAQEIHDKFQLSTENINSLLTVENIDKGELKTELEAEASIEKGFSIVEANYKFPLNDTTGRAGIISGVHDRLSILSSAAILKVLEIKDKTERKELQEAKKEEKREDKEVKKEIKEAKKEEKRENKEEQKNNKVTRNED